MISLEDKVLDYEYGVEFNSKLIVCSNCGIVTHDKKISKETIPLLYPSNYLAHKQSNTRLGFYEFLKNIITNGVIKKIARRLPPQGRFLEIGCGNCELIRRLSGKLLHANFIGVDIKAVPINPIERFNFIQGHFEEVSIPINSIDVIYSSNLIEHVADPREFIEKCFQVLKPGGIIIGITPNHLSWDRFIFKKFWAGYHYPRHTYIFNHNNISELLRQTRFMNIKVKGSYGFWYLSFANLFMPLHGSKKRGLLFFLITALFYPLDYLINRFTKHGSMSFEAEKENNA